MYQIVRAICNFFIFLYCKIVYRAKIIGTENIPKTGPVIFCANHKSFLDPPLLEVTCKRNDKDLGPMKESLKTLKDGKCLAIFPEGTRNGLKKGLKPKTGVAYFALNSNATVIPVGIKGGEKPFKKATITYGEPLDLESYKGNKDLKKDKEILVEVTGKIMDNIMRLAK